MVERFGEISSEEVIVTTATNQSFDSPFALLSAMLFHRTLPVRI
jgi:hypothetical protein